MKTKFRIKTILILLMALLLAETGLPLLAVQAERENTGYDAIDRHLEAQLKELNLPGVSLVIVEGDQIVHQKSFGIASPDGKSPTPQTPYVIASLTKSFTAAAVMQLVEAGKVDLDAPLQRYLPWFRVADPQASTQITVRHLLNQSSGFSQTAGWICLQDFDNSPDASERQARALATYRLTRPVGSEFEYSNVNYNLLGLLIEATSGESYADYIQKHIFTPLDMRHSYTSKAAARQNGLGSGYQLWFGFPLAVPDLPVPAGSLASGQLISSSEDIGHYLIAQLNGGRYGNKQILSPASIAEMHRPAVKAGDMGIEIGDYGMGWFIEKSGQGTRIWHNGTAPDYYAYMALLPEQGRALAILVNGNHLASNMALNFAGMDAATLLAGAQPETPDLSFMPWALRAFLSIPLLQIIAIITTLAKLKDWQKEPTRRPGRVRLWLVHILLPLVPNLALVTIAVCLLTSGVLQFMLLFLPDLSSLALACGAFALLWSIIRSGLILKSLAQ
jgi:CubicO group peptidase (beta-lactamase class C family)